MLAGLLALSQWSKRIDEIIFLVQGRLSFSLSPRPVQNPNVRTVEVSFEQLYCL